MVLFDDLVYVHILDEYIDLPFNDKDIVYITNLQIATSLINKYPQFSKRINVPTLGKKLAERGVKSIRKGRKKTTYYIIRSTSKIIGLINSDNQLFGTGDDNTLNN